MTYTVINHDINLKTRSRHRIGDVLPEGFQVMALDTQAVFELANLLVGQSFLP